MSTKVKKHSTVPASLLLVNPVQLRWMDNELKQIQMNHGRHIGRATAVRGIIAGLFEAGLSLADCRSEFEISDCIRDMVRAAKATTVRQEVKA